jgi:hypothetical protein
MIEFTFTELALFMWGTVATAYAFKFHHEMIMAKFFLHKVLTEEAVRNELVEACKNFQKEHGL